MAVMKNMREYTKSILVILVLAFIGTIIFDWGMNVLGLKSNQGIIGKVNGVEITAREYDAAFTRELEAYRNRTGTSPPENQLDFIRNQVWESIVQRILINQTLQEKGISASNEEVIYRIFDDPPDFLRNQESFQNEQKQFDMAKYQAALRAPGSEAQWRYVEDIIRQQLPYDKLQQRLMASIRITEDEIRKEYIKQNLKVKVKYIFIESSRFLHENIEITDAMIEAYYKANKEDFREEEKRKIQYAVFSTKATAEDSANTREEANNLLDRIKQGANFAELAEIYSEDAGSKEKGGGLGYFSKGTMVKPFEEAAFSANIGEIVGPVQSNFGLHIIKVEDKRIKEGKEEVKASHILLKFTASQKTIDAASDDANYLAEEAKKRPFEEVVKELNVEIQTSDFFPKGAGFIPGIGLNKRASNFIFTSNVGKTSNADEAPQGFFVYRVAEIQKERIKPIDEVYDTIKEKLIADRRTSLAGELAQKLFEKIQSGQSFEEVALQDSLEIKETTSFNRSGYVSGVGREANFVGAAFALKKINDISKPVEATRGYYLLQLMEKDEFNAEDFNAKKNNLAQQILQRQQNQAFANWYASIKEKADIKDDRDKYF